MKYIYIFIFILLFQSVQSQVPRTEENFNEKWLFARYGLQPDGSRIAEPGNIYKFSLKSSSEDTMPAFAMDNDKGSYWQPSKSDKEPWISVDLGSEQYIDKCYLDIAGKYESVHITGSNNAEDWHKLPGKFQYIKVSIKRIADNNNTVQIKEIKLFDGNNNLIINNKLPSVSPEKIAFDDADWRELDLPHDWGIEGPFRMDLDGYTGKLPWRGIGWYRKHFSVSSSEKGKQFYVDFDGAMANAEVWLNGNKIGERPYGYSSFRVNLTPHILFERDNVLAVRLNTEKLGSRWYPGAGIYRNVRLVKTEPVHIAQLGVFVYTPEVNKDYASVSVELKVLNNSSKPTDIHYDIEIFELEKDDKVGKKNITVNGNSFKIKANSEKTDSISFKILNPKLWSIEETNRYLVRVKIYENNQLTDIYDTPFGIRTIEFTHDNGFLLNGKRVQINGVCNHHDLGALGTAVNVSALTRQLRILKSFGCNAIRTSHNPPAPELLTLADKMGFLVMDEAFDCWETGKNPFDYGYLYPEWHCKDLETLICRDRNHPSVILWSTGNEVEEQYHPEKGIAQHLTDIIHEYDHTRPATFGASYPSKSAVNGTELQVDVHGMNYPAGVYGGPDLYGEFLNKKGHEHLSGYASETSSTYSSRGEYFPRPFQVSSYDLAEPGWGGLPDQEWTALDKYPAICGEFVWTGFDYLGEPTPFNSDFSILLNHASLNPEQMEKEKEALEKIAQSRPTSRSSYFGIVDIAGFPKDRYYLYQSRWMPDYPMAHILPHWNFPERTGEVTPVFVYTSGDEAELFLNGKSLGRKKKGEYEYRLRWDDVIYEPGTLKVIAYKNGKKWAVNEVKTTGAPSKLKLSAEEKSIRANGEDLAFIKVEITDRDGNMVPTANNILSCRLQGDGEIVATDNGDATFLITFSEPERPAFNGLYLAIVKAKRHARGTLKLIVKSDGLEAGTIEIPIAN